MNAIVTAILGFVAQVLGSLIQRSKTGVDSDVDQGLLRRSGGRLRSWLQSRSADSRIESNQGGAGLPNEGVLPDQRGMGSD